MEDSATVSTSELIAVGGAVFVAALIQVVAGFGFGVLSVPLMTLAVSTKEAVVISSLLGLTISCWQAVHGRAEANRPVAKRMLGAAFVGMPLGLFIFVVVDDEVLRIALGVAVLLSVVLLLFQYPRKEVGVGLDYGAGFISGVLNTSLSTNGPPLVFALQARRLPSAEFRSTIATVFAVSNIVAVTMFALAGKLDSRGLVAAAVAFPAMLIGQAAGFPLRKHVKEEQFRWLVLVLLTVAGLSAISRSLL